MFNAAILNLCAVVHDNVLELPNKEFAMLRRDGLGASDTSAILGAMDKFKTADDILVQKLSKEYTDEEAEVSDKVSVRMGKDLEPLILHKAGDALDAPVIKMQQMYRLKDYPWLTVNFDGIILREYGTVCTPVEAKLCTTYGDKYYDFSQANGLCTAFPGKPANLDVEFIKECAKFHGVPANYLVQLQQQLLGCGASEGYLAVLRVKDWTLYLFRIPRYEWLIQQMITETYKFWNKVLKLKGVS